MLQQSKGLHLAAGGIGALALAAAMFMAAQPASAAPETAGAARLDSVNQVLTVGPSREAYHGAFGDGLGAGDYEEALAAALGITVEELESAYESAWAAALEQAVEEGDLTMEQAEALQEGELARGHIGRFGIPGVSQMDELLAEALGISVDELNDARTEARRTLLEQAVDAGDLTEEEASLMLARESLRPYVEEAIADAYASAIEQAVADGAITQEQAEQLLEERTERMERGFFGGFGHPGRGERGFMPGDAPDTGSDDADGVRGWFFNNLTGRRA